MILESDVVRPITLGAHFVKEFVVCAHPDANRLQILSSLAVQGYLDEADGTVVGPLKDWCPHARKHYRITRPEPKEDAA